MSTLSADQRHVMTYVYGVTSTVSMIGSLMIFVSFFLVADVAKRPLMRMVFYMAITDFLLSFKYWLPAVAGTLDGVDYRPDSHWCTFEGTFSQFFGTASVSWYFCIAVNTFSALTSPLHFQRKHLLPLYHMFVWGLSGFSTIIIWVNAGWGPSGDGTCWITDANGQWRLFFYIPLFIYVLFAFVLLGYILYYRRILSFGNPNNLVARMIAFVLIFILTWLWVSFQRFWEYFTPSSSPAYLLIPHCIAISGQGFGNFCVWISSPAFGSVVGCRLPCCSESAIREKLTSYQSSTPGHEQSSDDDADSAGAGAAGLGAAAAGGDSANGTYGAGGTTRSAPAGGARAGDSRSGVDGLPSVASLTHSIKLVDERDRREGSSLLDPLAPDPDL